MMQSGFSARVRERTLKYTSLVQPRMGFSSLPAMARGLSEVSTVSGSVGTITVDSFTRVGNAKRARLAYTRGEELNGYPLLAIPADETREMVGAFRSAGLDIQLRHGTPDPRKLFEHLHETGLAITEGGPVSYALPYGRRKLRETIPAWQEAVQTLARSVDGEYGHVETFGGCMLGQLCPPPMLLAISVLEALFLEDAGIRDLSLSYAQQTDVGQDLEALRALNALAAHYLSADTRWHTVLYCYMGLFPRTPGGASALNMTGAVLAGIGGAQRYIVKTRAEARGIPTIEENVDALFEARTTIDQVTGQERAARELSEKLDLLHPSVESEARLIIDRVLAEADSIAGCLTAGFAKGYLDVPYCLHPDNRGDTTSQIAPDGRLLWGRTGNVPVLSAGYEETVHSEAQEFLDGLSYIRDRYELPDAGRLSQQLLSLT